MVRRIEKLDSVAGTPEIYCRVLEPNFAPDPDGLTDYSNPWLFTGRAVDILDNSSLKIQYNRNRYYDQYTGRWTTEDPWEYIDGANLYDYVGSHPLVGTDSLGLSWAVCNSCEYVHFKTCYVKKRGIEFRWNRGHWLRRYIDDGAFAMLTLSARLSVKLMGSLAGYIAGALPTIDYVDWVRVRSFRVEVYQFQHYRCGGNCRWDLKSGRSKQREMKFTSAEFEGDPHERSKWTLKTSVAKLMEENWNELVGAMQASAACRIEMFKCSKGKPARRVKSDQEETQEKPQKCESFRWEHE